MTRRIFIDVDTQNDFCTSAGALSVTDTSDPVVQNIKRLVKLAVEDSTLIIGSVDSHAFDSWEFYTNPNKGPNGEKPNFRPHCIKGEYGWLKVAGTLPDRFRFIPNNKLQLVDFKKLMTADVQGFYLEKEVYSLFANPNALALLWNQVGSPVVQGDSNELVQFVVFGVATDYCVKAAVEGLVKWCQQVEMNNDSSKFNFEVVVVTDAIAPVTKAGGEAALAQMGLLEGVAFKSTDDLAGEKPEPASAKVRSGKK